jgi:hypothetical protein
MSICQDTAIVTLSVDLALNAATNDDQRRLFDETAIALASLLNEHRLSVTWAIDKPSAWSAGSRSHVTAAGSEVSLLGQGRWADGSLDRSAASREIATAIQQAQAGGFSISSLAVAGDIDAQLAEVAARQGIRAVRHGSTDPSLKARGSQPRPMQSGMWGFVTSVTLPAPESWFASSRGRKARVAVEAAIAQRGLAHIVVDMAALAAAARSQQRALVRFVHYLAQSRQQRMLEVLSIQDTAARLSGRYKSQPSRSILHSAA